MGVCVCVCACEKVLIVRYNGRCKALGTLTLSKMVTQGGCHSGEGIHPQNTPHFGYSRIIHGNTKQCVIY